MLRFMMVFAFSEWGYSDLFRRKKSTTQTKVSSKNRPFVLSVRTPTYAKIQNSQPGFQRSSPA